MRLLPLFCALLFSSGLLAQTVTPIQQVVLDEVTAENRPLIHSSEKFKLSLMNGFCGLNKAEVKLSRGEVVRNLDFYKRELPQLLRKFESLMNGVRPDFFIKNKNFYPLDIHLSLDGSEDCYNASAEGSHIELPAQPSPSVMKAVFELLYHEIGHSMSYSNGHDQNLFDEAIADAISLLLFNPNGVLSLGSASEKEEMERNIELGHKDPIALATELEIESSGIASWLKEHEVKLKCMSDKHFRDMRNNIPLSDALAGGGESYTVSCSIHSFFKKLGEVLGHEKVLKTFLKKYLDDPAAFNEIDIPRLIKSMFQNVDHISIDPSFSRLQLRPSKTFMEVSLTPISDEEGSHYQLYWNNPELGMDRGVVAFKDIRQKSVASYSLPNGKPGVVLTPQLPESCEEERLLCYCPDVRNQMTLQFG
jgi:hypothetical protein